MPVILRCQVVAHLLAPCRHVWILFQFEPVDNLLAVAHETDKLVAGPIIDELSQGFLSLTRAFDRRLSKMGLGITPRFEIRLSGDLSAWHEAPSVRTYLLHSPEQDQPFLYAPTGPCTP